MIKKSDRLERSFDPSIREALKIIFQLDGNGPPCPKFLVDVAQRLFPELQNKTSLSKEKSYMQFKGRLANVTRQIAPFYGTFPGSEREKWKSPEDQEIISRLTQRYQRHQVFAILTEFMRRAPNKNYLRDKL